MMGGEGGVEIRRWGCRDIEVVGGDGDVEIQKWWVEMGM